MPKDDEVLIRTCATTVTAGDCRVRSLHLPPGFGFIGRLALGISGPRQPILGSELSGIVESIGRGVTKFKVGDEVFGFTGARLGCHAEYKCMRESAAAAIKPSNLGFAESAAIASGGTTALGFLKKGKLRKGERILVNGASGSVGMAAVQIARHFGAEVTGVCSGPNVEMVRALGARHVIDYTREDFTKNRETYDVIMDTAGTAPFSRSKGSLKKKGRLLLVLSGLGDLLHAPWAWLTTGKRVIAGPAPWQAEDIHSLAKLAEMGEFKPVIDRQYPFEAMADAHRYVDAGHKKGNVVVLLSKLHEGIP